MKNPFPAIGAFLKKNTATISIILNILGGAGIVPPVLAPVVKAAVAALAAAPAPVPAPPPGPVLQP